jgi:hypothetical protein
VAIATISRSRESRLGRRAFAGVDLVSARCFIKKCFLNIEAQAVLVQRLSIGGLVTHHTQGIIRLLKQAGQSQRDRPNGCS